MIKIGINGFGRIGRLVFRASLNHKNVEVVGINDLLAPDYMAYMLKYDTIHGRFKGTVDFTDHSLIVDGHEIRVTTEKNPADLKWGEIGAEYVVESTGLFLSQDKAQGHIDAGAKHVILSAPSKDSTPMFVMGVNNHKYTSDMKFVSNASCTTNCLSPVAKVLNDTVGITRGFMTTIHSYTGDQPTLDTMHKDLYRARAAALSMIPTSTGAAKAVGLVLPELKGKLDGVAIRVPTPNVSVVDLTFEAARDTSVEEINNAIRAAADGPLKGILGYNTAPLVSVDFNHNPASSTYDETLTKVSGRLVKVNSWYDNEWGFSNRMADTTAALGKTL